MQKKDNLRGVAEVAKEIGEDHVYGVIKKEKEKQAKAEIMAKAARNEFEALVQFADSGNPEGMYYLAKSYFEGITSGNTVILKPNLDKAIQYYIRSLNGGYQKAFAELQKCQEIKAKEDEKKKAKMVAQAAKNEFKALVQFADSGNVDAMFFLGQNYAEGVTSGDTVIVKPDIDKAIGYFTKALAGGKQEAFEELQKYQAIKAKADQEKRERIAAKAAKNEFDSLVQFAKSGNTQAQYILAMTYFEGVKSGETVVVEPDEVAAMSWLKRSSMKGNADAAKKLEELKKNSEG